MRSGSDVLLACLIEGFLPRALIYLRVCAVCFAGFFFPPVRGCPRVCVLAEFVAQTRSLTDRFCPEALAVT